MQDALTKASSSREGDGLLQKSSVKPKVLGRVATILLASRSPVVDDDLMKGVPALINDARNRLAAAVSLDKKTNPDRALRIETEERFLEMATRVILKALRKDLETADGECDDVECFRLRFSEMDEDSLLPKNEEEFERLTNAAVARLLIEAIRALLRTLGIADELSVSVLTLVEHLNKMEDATMRQKRIRLEKDSILRSIDSRKKARLSVPDENDPSRDDIFSYVNWLTTQSMLQR